MFQESLDGIAILRIDGYTRASGNTWSSVFLSGAFADTLRHPGGSIEIRHWQNESKLVAAEACRRIYIPAAATQHKPSFLNRSRSVEPVSLLRSRIVTTRRARKLPVSPELAELDRADFPRAHRSR